MTPGMVTLVMRDGYPAPSVVFLIDGSKVVPDVNGQIAVPLSAAQPLFSAGWIEPQAPAVGLTSAVDPGAQLSLDPTTGDVFQESNS